MRRLDLPTLHILSADDAVLQRLRGLDAAWRTQRLTLTRELDNLPAGNLVFIDIAHPQCPAWTDPRWRVWCGHLSVIIASSEPNDAEGIAAMDAGASGYCHAYANEATLQQVLEVVASGELWVGRSLLTRLLKGVDRGVEQREAATPNQSWRAKLTEREGEVAHMAAQGASNLGIAEALGITERTVKAHLTTIFEKLEVADRLQLALKVHGVK